MYADKIYAAIFPSERHGKKSHYYFGETSTFVMVNKNISPIAFVVR